ncbi:MAG: exo-alpha-sialidase [Deltaproteobacteria bacterium]|nr:exo-alpha-sialidase [Deltaproteobacteria bacterium]
MVLAMVAGLTFLVGCKEKSQSDSASSARPAANTPASGSTSSSAKAASAAPASGGRFLLYYYPSRALFESKDGKAWTKIGGSDAWVTQMAAGADGTLYAADMGEKPNVKTSTDGQSWTKVEPSAETPKGPNSSYVLCSNPSGAEKAVYELSSTGAFYASSDGGKSFQEMTRPVAKDAKGEALGFSGSCAVSPDGAKILVQGWYFDPAGPVLAITEDRGKTWKKIKSPTKRNESVGVAWIDGGIFYAGFDLEAGMQSAWTTTDGGEHWTKTGTTLLAPQSKGSFYSYRKFASDGHGVVVGVEAASTGKDEDNKWPGATFYSKDSGKTFEVLPFAVGADPTPEVSDEYMALAYVAK